MRFCSTSSFFPDFPFRHLTNYTTIIADYEFCSYAHLKNGELSFKVLEADIKTRNTNIVNAGIIMQTFRKLSKKMLSILYISLYIMCSCVCVLYVCASVCVRACVCMRVCVVCVCMCMCVWCVMCVCMCVPVFLFLLFPVTL